MFQKILEAIKKYDRIIIHRHTKPDGDAIGSQVGLKHIIKSSFPEKEVYAVGDGAGRYSFMDGSEMDVIDDGLYKDALAVILDTSASQLISDERYKTADMTVRFDHHISCEQIADVEAVDTSFESCCGLITQFALDMSLCIPDLAAKSLYTGMVTDSGRFRYDSTTSKTFALASELLKRDFDICEIYSNLYADDWSRVRLRAEFILKVKFSERGVAYIYTTAEELKASGADPFTVSRGMVGTMSDIKGIDIWVNFTENGDGVMCEIRSSKYNINPVAVAHGGGGHAKASGATLRDRDEAMCMIGELEALLQ